MNNNRLPYIATVLLLIGLFISGCGPSPEELAATSAAETAAAATNTPIPTSTPSPTDTHTPLPPTLTPTLFPPFRDDFTQLLEDGWEWLQESRFGWNLHEKPGFLRIDVALDTKQVLVRKAPEGNFEISTRVLFTPYHNFQAAGLIILQDDGHWLQFHRAMAWFPNFPEAFGGNALYYNNIDYDLGVPGEGYSIGPQYPTKTDELDEAYLRLTRVGRTYTAYYSGDGEQWIPIGKHETDLEPSYVGIHTCCAEVYMAEADFDYFTLEILP